MKTYLDRFPAMNVLVVGDVLIDQYVWGSVRRISPEAPVPVVEWERESYTLGGAGNVAANVASLGAVPHLTGVVGADSLATQVGELLDSQQMDRAGLVIDPRRPTTAKTRIIAQAQQIARIDREVTAPLPKAVEDDILARIGSRMSGVQGCILSDYAKGVLTDRVVTHTLAAAREAGVPVFVDPKNLPYARFRGCSLFKPNLQESERLTGSPIRSLADVERAGEMLLAELPGSRVLMTRGSQGMSIFEEGQGAVHLTPIRGRRVFDVTGAGDTVIAVVALALMAGATLPEAARLADIAAGFVIGVMGTATIPLGELRAALDQPT